MKLKYQVKDFYDSDNYFHYYSIKGDNIANYHFCTTRFPYCHRKDIGLGSDFYLWNCRLLPYSFIRNHPIGIKIKEK